MTTSIGGAAGITFNDGSVLGSQLGIFNRIIDGGFTINQRGYVSGTSLPSGTYGHDRWKGGASAGTYTFTQGALGVNTTITITAGSIIQVIEGCNLPEGGTYVLSWTGTAQGRLNGGTFGSSGTVTVTGWVAGTNLNVEFNTGTCGSVQLVAGSAVSSYSYRPYGTELMLCQRYYLKISNSSTSLFGLIGQVASATTSQFAVNLAMRTTPTCIASNISVNDTSANSAVSAVVATSTNVGSVYLTMTQTVGLIAGRAATLIVLSGSGYLDMSAEL